MKALTIPTLILVLLFTLSLGSAAAVKAQTEACLRPLSSLDELAQVENWHMTTEHLQQSYQIWQQNQFFFHTIMEHQELDETESLFASAFAACKEEDEPDFHMTLAQLKISLQHLSEKQQISLGNIL